MAPNPFVSQAVFTIDALEEITQALQFQLIDINGKLVRNESFFGNQFTLERNGLPSGVYFFSILSEKMKSYSPPEKSPPTKLNNKEALKCSLHLKWRLF